MTTEIELSKAQEKLFKPGCFVALHSDSQHHDAGRIGKIISCDGTAMLVEFFSDELLGKSEYSMIPFGHWAPVPEFMVEEYQPRALRRGWRVTERGMAMFREFGWGFTPATEGKA